MPSTHDHTVTRDRILLLYCILHGHRFNIGRLINWQITICAGRHHGGLWFPSLITQLCQAQGVPIEPNEAFEQSAKSISRATICRLIPEEARSAATEEPLDPTDNIHPHQLGHRTTEGSSPGDRYHMLEQRISQMEVMQYHTLELLRVHWKYEQQRDLAIQRNYRANSRRFHTFPAFPKQLITSDEDDEDKEEEEAAEEAAEQEAEQEAEREVEEDSDEVEEVNPSQPANTATSKRKGKAAVTSPPQRQNLRRSMRCASRRA